MKKPFVLGVLAVVLSLVVGVAPIQVRPAGDSSSPPDVGVPSPKPPGSISCGELPAMRLIVPYSHPLPVLNRNGIVLSPANILSRSLKQAGAPQDFEEDGRRFVAISGLSAGDRDIALTAEVLSYDESGPTIVMRLIPVQISVSGVDLGFLVSGLYDNPTTVEVTGVGDNVLRYTLDAVDKDGRVTVAVSIWSTLDGNGNVVHSVAKQCLCCDGLRVQSAGGCSTKNCADEVDCPKAAGKCLNVEMSGPPLWVVVAAVALALIGRNGRLLCAGV